MLLEKDAQMVTHLASHLADQPPEMLLATAVELSGRASDAIGMYCMLVGHEETVHLVDIIKETFTEMRAYNEQAHEAFKMALELQQDMKEL